MTEDVIPCQEKAYTSPEELAQLSQLGIKIGVIDSAKAVSFHHKTGHLAVGCISSAVVVWANRL